MGLDKTVTVCGIFEELKRSGDYHAINVDLDRKNNVLNINVVPKQTIEYIQVEMTMININFEK